MVCSGQHELELTHIDRALTSPVRALLHDRRGAQLGLPTALLNYILPTTRAPNGSCRGIYGAQALNGVLRSGRTASRSSMDDPVQARACTHRIKEHSQRRH